MTFFEDTPQRMKTRLVGWMEGYDESGIGEEGEGNHRRQRQR